MNPDDGSSAVQIHRGARLRAIGLKTPNSAIPDYWLSAEESGNWCWTLNPAKQVRGTPSRDNFSIGKPNCPLFALTPMATVLCEAPFGGLEQWLLGYTA